MHRLCSLAVFVSLIAPLVALAQTPSPGALAGMTAFVDVAVVPMDRERVLPNQTVLVAGGRITALGPSAKIKVPAGAARIDGRGKYLMPGLADMHAHLLMENDGQRVADSAEVERRLFLFLANGVTTVRNMDHDGMFLRRLDDGTLSDSGSAAKSALALRLRARAAAGTLWSPRIYTSGYLGKRLETTPAQMAALVAAYKAAGYDFLKVHEPPGTNLEDTLARYHRVVYDSLTAAARRLGVPFAGHVDRLGLATVLAAGQASIEHLHPYLEYLLGGLPGRSRPPGISDSAAAAAQLRQLDWAKLPAIVAATRRAGVWNSPNLALWEDLVLVDEASMRQRPETRYVSAQARAFWPWGLRGEAHPLSIGGLGLLINRGMLDAARRVVKALQEEGAGLLLGTDAFGYTVPGFAVHRELAALVRAGLTPYQALLTGTRHVAVFLGREAESGTVAVGKRADLVLLQGNPLQDVRHTAQPAGVMLGGRWLARAALERRLAALVAPAPARGVGPGHGDPVGTGAGR